MWRQNLTKQLLEMDTENRFAHLLRPIRDLSENWNIDIAKYLEDYIQEVIDNRTTLQRLNRIFVPSRLKESPFRSTMALTS